MWLLEALVFLTAIASAYAAILSIRASIGESPFLFLRLLTMAQDPLPSFIALLGFLIPLVAIAIGFDDPATGALKNCYAVSRGPGKPDTTQYGLVPSNIIDEGHIWPHGQNYGVLPSRTSFD